jgi:predicted aldo/keto reductase-like oxidoreductase
VLIKRVEASLKRLQTDYLDVAMVHSVDEPENIAHPEVMAAFTQLKKTGKVRFIGFSTHQADKLLPKAMELGLWEVVLMIYNHMEGPKVEPLIDQARKQGIGLIAMKVFAGGMQGDLKKLVNGKQRYSQAAIRWVLGNPNIDACIVTLSTFSHVEEYLAASGSPLKHGDKKLLSQYHQNFDRHYCRVSCSECLSSCPYGVEVNSILRYGMYYRYYGMEKTAIQLYKDTNPLKKAFACYGCTGPCRKRCPYELAVQEKLIQCHQLLRV